MNEGDLKQCLDKDLMAIGKSQHASAIPNALGPHRHDNAYELCFIKRGETHWWVGNERFSVQPGECFLTWPDELHGGQDEVMDACSLYWVCFRLDPQKGSFGWSAEQTQSVVERLHHCQRRQWRAAPSISQHYDGILQAHAQQDAWSHQRLGSHLFLLIDQALNWQNEAPAAPPLSERIRNTLAWMSDHLHEALSLEDLAHSADLQTSQFRDVFRRETGHSPIEYPHKNAHSPGQRNAAG